MSKTVVRGVSLPKSFWAESNDAGLPCWWRSVVAAYVAKFGEEPRLPSIEVVEAALAKLKGEGAPKQEAGRGV